MSGKRGRPAKEQDGRVKMCFYLPTDLSDYCLQESAQSRQTRTDWMIDLLREAKGRSEEQGGQGL